jgi:carbonic anhydrase
VAGAALSGTKVILVMGHANCSAVKATRAKRFPGSALYPHIQPAVNRAGENLGAATHANAKIQARLLGESSTVIKGLVKDGEAEGCGGVL